VRPVVDGAVAIVVQAISQVVISSRIDMWIAVVAIPLQDGIPIPIKVRFRLEAVGIRSR
jgi:hypothetical protein